MIVSRGPGQGGCAVLLTVSLFACRPIRSACHLTKRNLVFTEMRNQQTSSPKKSTLSTFSKRILLLRHGQAQHNPRAEAEKDAGCSYERFLDLMRQDDCFDAPLTQLGEQQALSARDQYGQYLQGIDLVVASPLSRALKTADLAFPPQPRHPRIPNADDTKSEEKPSSLGMADAKNEVIQEQQLAASAAGTIYPKRVCVEDFREINGWLLNAKRRERADLERLHPEWDFSELAAADATWTETLEAQESAAERGYQGLLWCAGRPEQRILVVAHGGIFRFLKTLHPLVEVHDGRDTAGDAVGEDAKCPKRRFGNCEMREYVMQWSVDAADADQARPVISLTEIAAGS